MYSLILKSSENWKSRGSSEINKLNTDCLFETDNEFGFPEVASSEDFKVQDLIPFNLCTKKKAADRNKAVHFFLDDYKFEQIWTRPKDFLNLFRYYKNIVSPTFSVWENQPQALNLFNIYRSRWCTAFYQYFGINVLVNVGWAGEKTYPYCFSGIKKNSSVIVNTVGTRMLENRKIFVKGFEEMLRVVEPSKLYVYGEYMPVDFDKYFNEVVYFESFWKKQRDKIALKANSHKLRRS